MNKYTAGQYFQIIEKKEKNLQSRPFSITYTYEYHCE